MTATKSAVAFQASATNTAGSTTTGTSQSLATALQAFVVLIVANGSTGPTIGCDAIVEVSNDNTNWSEYVRATAPTTASTTFTFPVELPPSVLYVRTKFTGNTAQSVTVEARGHVLTAVS